MKSWMGGRTAINSYISTTWDPDDFRQVLRHALRLSQTIVEIGGYRQPVMELFYIDDESEVKVLAYRFTADALERRFSKYIAKPFFGRGVWNPWDDEHQYWEFFGCPCCGENPAHGFKEIIHGPKGRAYTCPTQQARINSNRENYHAVERS